MNKGKKCKKILILVGLLVLAGINIYSYTIKNIAKEMEIAEMGGIENYEKLQAAFETEKYREDRKVWVENTKKQFSDPRMEQQIEAMRKQRIAEKEAKAMRLKWGEDVLNVLKDIKNRHHFINGPKDARFTIVEYSEFLCPYCKKHSEAGTLEAVKETFKGKVNTIHVPYLVHAEAQNLELGLLCARDQKDAKTYYTFIKEMFKSPTEFRKPEENFKLLEGVAKKVGYDVKKLKKCVEDEVYVEELRNEASNVYKLFGVEGTPWNILIDTKTGKYYQIGGLAPKSMFENKINEILGQDK